MPIGHQSKDFGPAWDARLPGHAKIIPAPLSDPKPGIAPFQDLL
jgi:hypothetical protein